jgi:hypothetical protein
MSKSRKVRNKFIITKAISKFGSAETNKAIRLQLMKREQEGKVMPGLTGWVCSGIKIQEAQ